MQVMTFTVRITGVHYFIRQFIKAAICSGTRNAKSDRDYAEYANKELPEVHSSALEPTIHTICSSCRKRKLTKHSFSLTSILIGSSNFGVDLESLTFTSTSMVQEIPRISDIQHLWDLALNFEATS